jgi:hypothetical protein
LLATEVGSVLSHEVEVEVEVEGRGLGFENEDDIPLLVRKLCIEFQAGARGFMARLRGGVTLPPIYEVLAGLVQLI